MLNALQAIPLGFAEQIEIASYAVGIVSAGAVAATVFVTRTLPWLREWLNRRALHRRLGIDTYSDQQIHRAIRYYVPASCQQTDPSGMEEPRALALVQEPLFSALRRELDRPASIRHLIILADSGMGKTSAVLNYCARHLRGFGRHKYGIACFYLGLPDVDERIGAVDNSEKRNTVLFLDALDEDTRAIQNHHARIAQLVDLARPFRALVITCRSQFFTKDEEIPRETGIIKSGPRAAGEGAEYWFHKLYLSPFSDNQIKGYLRRRYPPWHRSKRQRARAILAQVPHLTARPMLLAHVDDLMHRDRHYRFPVEIYEEMVHSWIERERGLVKDPDALLQFSKRMAVDIYTNRERRGAESVRSNELEELAISWEVPLDRWVLTGRSLLNRDAVGNYKFAHRSIMEYLFVQSFWEGESLCASVPWTDQMSEFLLDRITGELLGGPHSEFPVKVKRALLPLRSGSFVLGALIKNAIRRVELERSGGASTNMLVNMMTLAGLCHLWIGRTSSVFVILKVLSGGKLLTQPWGIPQHLHDYALRKSLANELDLGKSIQLSFTTDQQHIKRRAERLASFLGRRIRLLGRLSVSDVFNVEEEPWDLEDSIWDQHEKDSGSE